MQALNFFLAMATLIISVITAAPFSNNTAPTLSVTISPFSNITTINTSLASSNVRIESRKAKWPPICENCMSCTAKQKGFKLIGYSLRYTLHIGAPYINGAGCDSIEKGMAQAPRHPGVLMPRRWVWHDEDRFRGDEGAVWLGDFEVLQ